LGKALYTEKDIGMLRSAAGVIIYCKAL
jgi:hypothetical protein